MLTPTQFLKVVGGSIVDFGSSIASVFSSMDTFLIGILLAVIIGLSSFLIGIKALSFIVPNWRLRDCFNRDKVTNSGIVVVSLISALALIIASAIY